MNMKFLATVLLTALMSPLAASAHSVTLGTVNAGAPGSVTLWLGSYHTGAPNEGSMTLNGVTQAFNLLSAALPAGLVYGDNNFWADNNGIAGSFNSLTCASCPAPTRWQGVTFSGLSAGTYSYGISGMFTVDYSDWNTSRSNWTGVLTIPGSSVNVPEPAVISLLGFGLALFGFAARRRQLKV